MQNIRSIAVFCGSKAGANPAHGEAAARFGRNLAAAGIRLVYGGGRIGLMGIVADAVMAAGGAVTGVIPRFISEFEIAHHNISELMEVESMHERKNKMFEASDAFVILPGGLGTLDEAMEIITWKQLQLHSKPIIVANLDNYWASWERVIEDVIAGEFAHPTARDLFSVVTDVDDILAAIAEAPEPGIEVLTDHL